MVLCAFSAIAAIGCAATPIAIAEGQAPADFTLDLTILNPEPPDPAADALPMHLRQSRYVLFADGSLHYGAEDKRGVDWLPPRTRTLSSRQVRELWLMLEQMGLADPDAELVQPAMNFKRIHPERGRVTYLAAIKANEQQWSIVREGAIDQPQDAAVIALIERLGELAWAADPHRAERPLPQRYHFGPDPYARYR